MHPLSASSSSTSSNLSPTSHYTYPLRNTHESSSGLPLSSSFLPPQSQPHHHHHHHHQQQPSLATWFENPFPLIRHPLPTPGGGTLPVGAGIKLSYEAALQQMAYERRQQQQQQQQQYEWEQQQQEQDQWERMGGLRQQAPQPPPPQPPPPPPPPPPSRATPHHATAEERSAITTTTTSNRSTHAADYTVRLTLPGWPEVVLIYYPGGCIHILCAGHPMGMFTAPVTVPYAPTHTAPLLPNKPARHEKEAARAGRAEVGVVVGPAVTQVAHGGGVEGDMLTYYVAGGKEVRFVPSSAAEGPQNEGGDGTLQRQQFPVPDIVPDDLEQRLAEAAARCRQQQQEEGAEEEEAAEGKGRSSAEEIVAENAEQKV